MAGTHNTTSVTYSHPSTDTTEELGQSGEWWVRIEQVDAEELASDKTTLAEAADVVDAVYELEPCSDPGATAGGEAAPAEPPITQEEYSALIDQKLDVPTCEQLEDGYREYLYVFRSQLSHPYELELSYGEVEETNHISETVEEFVVLSDEYQYSFSKPAFLPDYDTSTHPPFIEYLTKFYTAEGELENPSITISGSTINFEERVTGSLKITYPSQYDIVTILMEELQDIVVRAFYHGLVVDTGIHPRILDELDVEDCLNNFKRKTVFNHDGGCYQIQDTESRCKCSGDITVSERKVVAASCKDGDPRGTIYNDDGLDFNYVDCGEKEELNEQAYYESTCCQPLPPNKTLPLCEESKEIFMGGVEIENGKDWWKAKYGPDTAFIGLGPRYQTHCGETTHRWLIDEKDCCGDPSILPFTWEQTHDYIAWGDTKDFCVSGGVKPYTWETEGAGLVVESTWSTVDGGCAKIKANDCHCTPLYVKVTDACDQVLQHDVASEEGYWEEIPNSENPLYQPGALHKAVEGPIVGGYTWYSYATEEYKLTANLQRSSGSGTNWCLRNNTPPDHWGSGKGTPCFWAGNWYTLFCFPPGCISGNLDPLGLFDPQWDHPTVDPSGNFRYGDAYTATIFINGTDTCDIDARNTSVSFAFISCNVITSYKWVCDQNWDELIYDEDSSGGTIAANSTVGIAWQGGKAPYTVSVSGQGIFTESTRTATQKTTNSTSALLYSDASVCGILGVTIQDTCGESVSGEIQATNGRWESLGDAGEYPNCPSNVNPVSGWGNSGSYYQSSTTEYKGTKISEWLYFKYAYISPVTSSCEDCESKVESENYWASGVAAGCVPGKFSWQYPCQPYPSFPCMGRTDGGCACLTSRTVWTWVC